MKNDELKERIAGIIREDFLGCDFYTPREIRTTNETADRILALIHPQESKDDRVRREAIVWMRLIAEHPAQEFYKPLAEYVLAQLEEPEPKKVKRVGFCAIVKGNPTLLSKTKEDVDRIWNGQWPVARVEWEEPA
jgi:hypothetical protein